jgi:hypothetical protein
VLHALMVTANPPYLLEQFLRVKAHLLVLDLKALPHKAKDKGRGRDTDKDKDKDKDRILLLGLKVLPPLRLMDKSLLMPMPMLE